MISAQAISSGIYLPPAPIPVEPEPIEPEQPATLEVRSEWKRSVMARVLRDRAAKSENRRIEASMLHLADLIAAHSAGYPNLWIGADGGLPMSFSSRAETFVASQSALAGLS